MWKSRIVFVVLVLVVFAEGSRSDEFRSLSGHGNNLAHSEWGGAGSNLRRITLPAYQDGQSQLRSGPNVRLMSNHIYRQSAPISDERNLSQINWAWGQFLAHDLDLTPLQDSDTGERIDISIPVDDAVFQSSQFIPVTRSVYDPMTGSVGVPREHPNVISSYIDGNVVYGGASDEPEFGSDRAGWLRDPLNPAKLRVSRYAEGDLLPQRGFDPSAPAMAMASRMGESAFVAGDRRANEHAVLATMHTLFVREHNRIADLLLAEENTASDAEASNMLMDDYVYQRARKLVGAEIQAITYAEYLPSLGLTLSPYGGYDDQANPDVSPEFSVAAFRLGHTQVNGVVPRLDVTGRPIAAGPLELAQSFFEPRVLVDEGGIDPILRGLASSRQEAIDAKMRDGLRNLLFGPPNSGPVANGSDLAALNTIRGRDHGLPTYAEAWRQLLGDDTAPKSFSDLSPSLEVQAALASVYPTVEEIDLWVGLLCEPHSTESSVGPLTAYIIADQFERVRDGDRFYYENDLDLRRWHTFSDEMTDLDWIMQMTLGDVIRANSDVVSLQSNVFYAVVPEPNAMASWTVCLGLLLIVKNECNARRKLRNGR